MYALLIERFGVENVERQAKPSGTNWPIDFYVKPINVWLQVDGVYWHGLDRPIEEHIRSGSPRSASIVGKWHVDRAQDTWFAKHSMRLVRVTDKQVAQVSDISLLLKTS